MLPVIGELRRQGVATSRALAAALNARGVRTSRGAEWTSAAVLRVLDRQEGRAFQPWRATSVFTGSAEIDATVAGVAPAVLELLADGAPRTKAAIIEALTGRHAEG